MGTENTIWGHLPGEPAFGANHQGCRRIRRGEPLPDGWQVVRQGNIYDYIKPVSEISSLRGGPKQLWIRQNAETILNYYREHGMDATRNRFNLKQETLEALLIGKSEPIKEPHSRLDKLELRLEIAIEDNRELRQGIKDLTEQFGHFQTEVANQISQRILLPLLRAGIKIDGDFYMDTEPNRLNPQDLPPRLKAGSAKHSGD